MSRTYITTQELETLDRAGMLSDCACSLLEARREIARLKMDRAVGVTNSVEIRDGKLYIVGPIGPANVADEFSAARFAALLEVVQTVRETLVGNWDAHHDAGVDGHPPRCRFCLATLADEHRDYCVLEVLDRALKNAAPGARMVLEKVREWDRSRHLVPHVLRWANATLNEGMRGQERAAEQLLVAVRNYRERATP